MDKYGLIGYPLGHSFSKGYFNEKFENEGIDAQYINFEIPSIEDLTEILDSNPELKGLNVTIPYKEKVISYLDQVSPEANAIGAVNVVKVEHKGDETILKGYNSDVIGFTQSIEPFIESFHKKALILGTGGASKAINYGLKSLGLETVFVSRYERPGTIQYDKITPEVIKEYNVIVNCTPVGMYPHVDECPPLPYEAMDTHTLLYDLIYNPDETLFMKKGKERGATESKVIGRYFLAETIYSSIVINDCSCKSNKKCPIRGNCSYKKEGVCPILKMGLAKGEIQLFLLL